MHAFRMFCLFLVAMLIAACTNNYRAPGTDKAGVPADTGFQSDSGNTEDSDADTDVDTDADTDADTDTDTDVGPDDCVDGTDNDGDGFVDSEDPGCADGDGLEGPFNEPEDTDVPDTGGDTGEEPEETAEDCWDAVPYTDINLRHVDHSVADYGTSNWASTGLDYVDVDIVSLFGDCFDSTACVLVSIQDPDSGSWEADIYVPLDVTVWYGLSDPDGEYDNGIYVFLQPDGTIYEVSYFSYSGGTYRGYVLPDSGNPVPEACGNGLITSYWAGSHGGSHFTATQAVRIGELTGSSPIGRPLPIEVDRTHLSNANGTGYVWPAASADSYWSVYSGTGDVYMGSILVVPETTDCTTMQTTPSERLCEVLRDYGMIVVDDSGGTNEVQVPMEEGVVSEVLASEDIDLVNAYRADYGGPGLCDGDEDLTLAYASDIETLMAMAVPLNNPEVSWVE